ncbi:hypothetical protein RND81_02G242900 [Saponaria officinalis]
MHLDEALLLSPSSGTAVIVPSVNTALDVLLFDRKANNKVVAQGRLFLDKIGDECEEDHIRKVYGKDECSFAHVHYTIFQYAVAATVDVLFFEEADSPHHSRVDTDDDDDNGEYAEESSDEFDLSHYNRTDCGDGGDGFVANVFGSITVHSKVNYGNDKGYPSISLFNKSPGQSVRVKSGGFVPLSRSIVAVPAYASSLVIEVNLSDRNTEKQIGNGVLEFKPRDDNTFKKDLVGEHGRVRVRVTWNHAYDQPLFRASEKNQECQQPKEVEDDGWDPDQELEVFSVVVHSKDFKPFSFYGTIDVRDLAIVSIFKKDKSCPQVCAKGGEIVTAKGTYRRSVCASGFFQINVDLKDATTGAQISNGYASWDDRIIGRWFDRRICSIIRGERGFAAVYYTAFFDGVSVVVDVKLFGENLAGYVYGKIVAHYATYAYSTPCAKYYEITLFDRHADGDGDQQAQPLQLLKPLVCMPRNSSLIITADLTLSSEPATSLRNSVHLKPDESGRLRGESWGIEVHLKPNKYY